MHTQTNVNIDKRVEEKRTKILTNQQEAIAYARQRRSYPYPVFDYDKKGKQFQYGYGIPK